MKSVNVVRVLVTQNFKQTPTPPRAQPTNFLTNLSDSLLSVSLISGSVQLPYLYVTKPNLPQFNFDNSQLLGRLSLHMFGGLCVQFLGAHIAHAAKHLNVTKPILHRA